MTKTDVMNMVERLGKSIDEEASLAAAVTAANDEAAAATKAIGEAARAKDAAAYKTALAGMQAAEAKRRGVQDAFHASAQTFMADRDALKSGVDQWATPVRPG